MKITVIAPFSFGYIDALVEKLKAKKNVQVTYINTGEISFSYSSRRQKLKNFFLKTFTGKNLKREYVSRQIREKLEPLSQQDITLIVRGDRLEKDLLRYLKSKSDKFIAFYFDANSNIPRQEDLIPLFDEVYSYEKEDVVKHGLKFITNFIPFDKTFLTNGKGVFNISSYDDRFDALKTIAEQIKSHDYPCEIIVRKEEPFSSDLIKLVPEYLAPEEVREHILACDILLEVQKEDQQGLSFRVFEALGYDKKLITSNKDIVSYDFYNPSNILVIDKNKPVITEEFLHTPYQPVPEEIKSRYRRNRWIREVFGVE